MGIAVMRALDRRAACAIACHDPPKNFRGRWPSMRSVSTRLWIGLAALALLASCSGQGCQGCNLQPIPGGFPAEARIENAAELRLARPGLDFIQSELGAIITGIIGTQ